MNLCKTCEFLHNDARRDHWRQWQCVAAPITPQRNPVTGDMTHAYELCWRRNDGTCEDYREGPNCFNPVNEKPDV